MTSKIRRRLVYKYTVIIAIMLLFFAFGGFAMCKYAVQKVLADTMFDALAAEIREAEDADIDENSPLEETVVESDIGSIYSYAYWFVDNRLVFAEHPQNALVDKLCREKISEYNSVMQLEKFSIYDEQNREWQFYMLAGNTDNGRVVILVNISPFKLLSLRYTYLVMFALLFMLAVAWSCGNFLADRTIAPLIKMLENQKRFVADASHELRTPLAVMLSSIELLELKMPQETLLSGMKEEVLNMSTLIGNLLELARADNRQLVVKKEKLELKPLIDRLLQKLSKHCQRQFVNSCNDGMYIIADKELLKRLLLILLDNAVKYSPENSKIEIKVRAEDKYCQIEVKDEGVGIAEKDIVHIFERFYRADKTRSRQMAGIGLGLSIAKEIIELHGGSIEVKSKLGKGSVFIVKLPNI